MSRILSTDDISVHTDIAYGQLDAHRLDLYIPNANSTSPKGPLICFVHGGAWRSEDKAHHAQLAVRLAQRTGYCVAVPNYRLTPSNPTAETALHHPAHAEDVLAALEFLVCPKSPIASSQGSSAGPGSTLMDPQALPYRSDEIYAIGHSCGAHILTSILLDSSQYTPSLTPSQNLLNSVSGVAMSEGIYDINLLLNSFPSYKEWFIVSVFGEKTDYAKDSTTSYPRRVNDRDPIWMIVHSTGDTLVDIAQSQAIYDYLQTHGSEVEKDWTTITTDHNDMLKTTEYSDLAGDFITGVAAKKPSEQRVEMSYKIEL